MPSSLFVGLIVSVALFIVADLVLYCFFVHPSSPRWTSFLPGSGAYLCWRELVQ